MEKQLMKLAMQAAFIAFVSWLVTAAMDKNKKPQPKPMPIGNEWVTGIVDGPSAQRSWYAPAVVMQ